MGTLFGFAVGYVVGTKAGREGLEEVVHAAKAVRDSEEFKALVDALRDHAQHLAHVVGDWVGGDDSPELEDLLAEARNRLGL